MEVFDLIKSRHSVRQYTDKKIPQDVIDKLVSYAETLNKQADLNIQIFFDELNCFNSRMAHYGKFENANNYIAMIGKNSADLEERCGYFGELLVLKAQELGLNSCWVKLTHGKSAAKKEKGEKEVIIISLGYGKSQGGKRKSKTISDVSDVSDNSPEWYRRGIEAALLAPTAINQQKFKFELKGDNKVSVKSGLVGPCLKIDLGIVKCHFELAAGKENFSWE